MSEMWFSRIRLSRNPSARALARLLQPDGMGEKRAAQHNLLWSVFADSADRKRDFLWREEGDGSFLTLSTRPPTQTDLFEAHQIKPWAPCLAAGDTLAFQLRANATRRKQNGARVDVVMDALHGLEREERAAQRMAVASREGEAWLTRQGEKAGFKVVTSVAEDYRAEVLPGHQGPRRNQPQFGILDLGGQIEITSPEPFLAQVAQGFGRAKSFGCGFMLIRRAI